MMMEAAEEAGPWQRQGSWDGSVHYEGGIPQATIAALHDRKIDAWFICWHVCLHAYMHAWHPMPPDQ